jgi:class 3 adenylate cyclase/tetratricopeptide (TPR) repeat protein
MATVLFTDLVGSTGLMSRLGEPAYDRLRDEHFARLRHVVMARGGDEVKNTGDGLLVVFSSAVEALEAAVAAQQATDDHGRAAGEPLAVRVGLSVGEVAFAADGDVFGTSVVEAARLVAAARPGQILCTALVRTMAGSRTAAVFGEDAELALKGLPDPVAVCTVAWEPRPAEQSEALPLPSLLTGQGRIFVGRDDELGRLRQAWKEVEGGGVRLVLLGGEPGVGKTRLAAQLAAELHEDGAVVLAGRCDEDLGVPYQPFVEALRHYVSSAAAPSLGRHAGELARLLPELSQLVPGLAEPLRSDPETERYRLFDAVAAWLGDVSASAPVLLVVDDLQWAAKPTLLLVRHVIRSGEPLRLLVLATYRDSEIGRGDPLAELLADIPRLDGAQRLPVGGLDVPAVVAFVERAAGHELDDEGQELARVVWRETAGNAFFVTEVFRHLAEARAIEQVDGRWVVRAGLDDLGIPEGVRDVVGRRLSRLSGDTNRVLSCAAVVGLEFDPAVVAAAGGLLEDAVITAIEDAVAARLVVEVTGPGPPRARFAHALVRATLYDELSRARRVALHRKVAEAIEGIFAEDLDDHLPALAQHWARAAAPAAETSRAVDYARRAGDRALAQLAYDEAAGWYCQALDLLDAARTPADDARRVGLLISLGDAERRAGDPAHRETLLRAAHLAQQRGDGDALARAALANHRGFFASGIGHVDAERVAALDAALAGVGATDSPIRAWLLAQLGDELTYGPDRKRSLRLSDEALAMARRLGDRETLVHVLLERAPTITAPESLAERLRNTEELLGLIQAESDPVIRGRALQHRFRVVMEAADFEEAERCFELYQETIVGLGQPTLEWFAGLNRAMRALLAGRQDEAESLARKTCEVGVASGQPDAALFLAGHLFSIRFIQGRLGDLEETIAEAFRLNPGLPALQAYLSLVLCEINRVDEARVLFDALAEQGFALPLDSMWNLAITACAAVCARLGDADRASTLHAMLAPSADRFVYTYGGLMGSIAHYLGLLAATAGWFAEAETHFTAAAEMHRRAGAPAWLAYTHLEWARMLLRRGDPGDAVRARRMLDQALASATELGLAGVEREATRLLAEGSA